MDSVVAWVCGWRASNFRIGQVGYVSPQNFGTDQNKWQNRNISVVETYDFVYFCYDSITFYL